MVTSYTTIGYQGTPTGGVVADPGRRRIPPVIQPPTGGIVAPPRIDPPIIQPPTGGIVPPPVTPPENPRKPHHNCNNQLLSLLMQIIQMLFGRINPMQQQQPYWPLYNNNQGTNSWYY